MIDPDIYYELDFPNGLSKYLYYLGIPYYIYKMHMFRAARILGRPLAPEWLIPREYFPYDPISPRIPPIFQDEVK